MKAINKYFFVFFVCFLLVGISIANLFAASRVQTYRLPPNVKIDGNRVEKLTILHYLSEGNKSYESGDLANALKLWEAGFAYAKKINHEWAMVVFLEKIGSVHLTTGKHQEAVSYFEQALKIARDQGYTSWEGASLHNIGMAYFQAGDYLKAITSYEQALKIAQSLLSGSKENEGTTLSAIGDIYIKTGNCDKAIYYYEQALKIQQSFFFGDKKQAGYTLVRIGNAYFHSGDYTKAILYYEQGIKDKDDKEEQKLMFERIGDAYYYLGDYSKAQLYYEKVLPMQKALKVDTKILEAKISGVQGGKIGFFRTSEALFQSDTFKKGDGKLKPAYDKEGESPQAKENELQKNSSNKLLTRQLMDVVNQLKKEENYIYLLEISPSEESRILKDKDVTKKIILKFNDMYKKSL